MKFTRMSYLSRLIMVSLSLVLAMAGPVFGKGLSQKPEIKNVIDQLVTRHGFQRQSLTDLFDNVELDERVVNAMKRPSERLPWHRYRGLFMTDDAIDNGVEFWAKWEDTLARAEKTYGVPAEVIVAIIGVETRYGKIKGKFPILNSLTTLVLDYPRRRKFFSEELIALMLLAREENKDPTIMKGSYAGAMGIPQFIASSYRRYAVDFDGDGKRDLLDNPVDAIGSVANFLAEHGWRRGGQMVTEISAVNNAKPGDWVTQKFKPKFTAAQLNAQGFVPAAPTDPDEVVGLVRYEEKNRDRYILGHANFYVITRYNRSTLYAGVVSEMAHSIAERRKK